VVTLAVESAEFLYPADTRVDRVRMYTEPASGFLHIQIGIGERPQCADKRAFGFRIRIDER
jgi:hypothetical protein